MENGIEMSTTATIAKLAGIDAVRKAAASLGVRTVVPGLVKFCGVCFSANEAPSGVRAKAYVAEIERVAEVLLAAARAIRDEYPA